MLLRGTKTRPSAFEISIVTDRLGAASNAFTGPERVYFYIQVAKQHLETVCDLLADIVLNSHFDRIGLLSANRIQTG